MELSDPIISRFDILCVVKDDADPMQDRKLAKFVVNSHMRHHPNAPKPDEENVEEETYGRDKPINLTLLKKYILYAKKNVEPKLPSVDNDKITKFYGKLRQESFVSKISSEFMCRC